MYGKQTKQSLKTGMGRNASYGGRNVAALWLGQGFFGLVYGLKIGHFGGLGGPGGKPICYFDFASLSDTFSIF
jgi:hypothetical protein